MSQAVAEPTDEVAEAPVAGTRGRLPLPVAAALAVAGGLLTLLAFPPTYWWPTAPLGVAALTFAVYGQRPRVGALLGLLYGVAFFPVLLFWVRVVGYDAWAVLSLIEALYLAGMGALLAVAVRLPYWPAWTACLWVGQEFVRGRFPLGGFSWGRLAFAAADSPYTQLAAVGGAVTVTFAVALTGGLVVWSVRYFLSGSVRPGMVAAAGAVAVTLVGLVVPQPAATGKSMTVAVIQGNVPRVGLNFLGQREAVLRNHAAATHELADDIDAGKVPRPDFVVWPENASDVNPFADPGARKIIEDAVADVGAPVLVGTLVETDDGKDLENTGIVWDPEEGPGDRYVKQHLVPFGEYVPFRPIMTKLVGRLDQIPRDMRPGTSPKPVSIGGYQVGDVMCFDVAFDDAVQKSMAGAGLLTVQTNNATYGGTLQLEQQFAVSRLRAVEYGRPVAVAATSGISGVIEPDGEVRAKTGQFTRAVLVERLPVVTEQTLAQRLGPWPERLFVLVGLGAVGAAVYLRRRRVQGT
ncbi:MAG: apolipoprotein N-acyltransferase [Streptosporangiales bacterium]|nr:apolipoprotein N-acyltransferase [Streptosporangiales bacterium]